MVAQKARCAGNENDQREAGGHKFCNCSMRSHGSSDLTAKGRRGRAEGRAKSPALNASAVAPVKMADCVS